jgi:hypothetical protein
MKIYILAFLCFLSTSCVALNIPKDPFKKETKAERIVYPFGETSEDTVYGKGIEDESK